MAMSGTITNQYISSGITVHKNIVWTAKKNTNDNTVTITCYYKHQTNPGYFYALGGDCVFTINGVDYTVSTKATDFYDTEFTTPSVTSDPIPITAIDVETSIPISAKWTPKTGVGYMRTNQSLEFTFKNTYVTSSGYADIDPFYTSTEIVLTGANEITEPSVIDVINNRTHSGVTHSLSYTCGKVTETLFTEETGNLEFTLPEELAAQNKSGLNLSVTFTLTTHFPWGVSGSRTSTVLFAIPDKDIFRPHCTIEVTDGEHLDNVQLVDRYGGFVFNKSRFKINVTPILAHGSEIATCTIKANDETHVGYQEIETTLLKHSGINNIVVTMTDNRGRSCEVTTTANVFEYQKPMVDIASLDRCDRNGVDDSGGDYLKVTFNSEITPLNNINSATYKLAYQTSAGLDPHDVNLTDYAGQHSVVGGTYIFLADSGNTYSVTLTAYDDLDSGSDHEGADESTTIWNALASGDGFAFGTIASLAGVLESMFKFYPHKGFMFPEFEESSIDSSVTPNVYTVASGKDVDNSPVDDGFTLIVLPFGSSGKIYIAITDEPDIYVLVYARSSWGSWHKIAFERVVPNNAIMSGNTLKMQRLETLETLFEVELPI